MKSKYYFAIDPNNYRGQVITSFDYETKEQHFNGGIGTVETYLQANPTHIVIDDNEHYDKWYEPFMTKSTSKVSEISYDLYIKLIEQLPPLRWGDGCYWCLEPNSGSYHTVWVNCHERYFETQASRFDSNESVLVRVNNFINSQL